MKTIGLIGGLTSFSTTVYYKTINQLINEKLGGVHSAKIILHSWNFHDFNILQQKGDWEQIENLFADISAKLQYAGADCILTCSNTSHIVADTLKNKIKIPLIHIADETIKEISNLKINKVALLGTKMTVENPFYVDRLLRAGIETIIPENADNEYIYNSIFNEFAKGHFKEETKKRYIEIINRLSEKGAKGIIFGCTEISILLNQSDCNVKIFDTTAIHSKAAVNFALNEH